MKLPNGALRKAYYDIISGLTYGGNPVAVYDTVAPDTIVQDREFLFVLLRDMNTSQYLKKHSNIHRVRINIEVVYGSTGNAGYKKCEELASLIEQAVSPQLGEALAPTGFSAMLTELVNTTNIFQDTTKHRVYRLVLTFEHNIGETS